jgi:hypothetical protein
MAIEPLLETDAASVNRLMPFDRNPEESQKSKLALGIG